MELLQLKYFQTVAKTENITQAAKELHIAQPSLSKTISRLEEQLEVKLFDRIGKRIKLNNYGKLFLVRVNRILDELNCGIKEMKELSNKNENTIVIGSSIPKLLPDLIKDYMLENTETKLHLLQITESNELLNRIETSKIDIAFSTAPIKKENISCKPLMEEKIYLIVPKNHSFANKESISLNQIEAEPIILYSAECGLRDTINQFFKQVDFRPNISCECTTPEVTCKLVQAGVGLAFLPEYLLNTEYTENLSFIPITNPNMMRTIWVIWNKNRNLSKATLTLRDFAFSYFCS